MTEDSYSILMPTIQEENPDHQSDPEDLVLRTVTKEEIRKRIDEMYYTDYTTMYIYGIVCCGCIAIVVLISVAAWRFQD